VRRLGAELAERRPAQAIDEGLRRGLECHLNTSSFVVVSADRQETAGSIESAACMDEDRASRQDVTKVEVRHNESLYPVMGP